jgi:ATP-dependent 26S proteasome regulatory subunit
LNDYEEVIAADIVLPEDIHVTFKGYFFHVIMEYFWFSYASLDIGGLDHIVESIKEVVLYPLHYATLFKNTSGLLTAPKGVLFYGPPGKKDDILMEQRRHSFFFSIIKGCGKTMLAKTIAKESGAIFIS